MNQYVEIFLWSLKNGKFTILLSMRFSKFMDIFRKKKIKQYETNSININEILNSVMDGFEPDWNSLSELDSHIDHFRESHTKLPYPSKENPYPVNFGLDKDFRRFLFSLCQYVKPDTVIETGIANGFSSSYILQSMSLRNSGKLFSIDDVFLPWHTFNKIGCAIPENLKKFHQIILGNSVPELKKILPELGSIDIFVHDSAHTFDNMMNEFTTVWPFIRKGGYLVSDDVSANDAFLDFCDKIKTRPYIIKGQEYGGHFGVIKKL